MGPTGMRIRLTARDQRLNDIVSLAKDYRPDASEKRDNESLLQKRLTFLSKLFKVSRGVYTKDFGSRVLRVRQF